jgi:hypothetical protein
MKQAKSWHTPKSPKGMGDGYGTGVKAKIGKIVDMYPVENFNEPAKNKGQPPRSLA